MCGRSSTAASAAPRRLKRGQPVLYITERCVFRLGPDGLDLTEIAPGIDLERDIFANMDFRPVVRGTPAHMDPRIFAVAPMHPGGTAMPGRNFLIQVCPLPATGDMLGALNLLEGEVAMTVKNEQLGELNRKNIEAAMRLAQLSIDNSQRVVALQNELARELFNDGVASARAQAGAKDPQELLQLRARYAQDTAQKVMATAQRVAEVGNEARVEFARMLTEQLASGSHEMADAFQGFFKAVPGQNANVLDIMQQAMATANSAFAQMTQACAAAFGGAAGPRAGKQK